MLFALLPVALATPTDCVGCHAGQHAQWAASQHATAFTDPAFQAAWRPWPDAWCLQCHAPMVAPWAPPGTRLHPDDPRLSSTGPAGDGVACLTCHPASHRNVSATPPPCEGCHDFAFQHHTAPTGGAPWPLTFSDEPLQDTADEWSASWFSEQGTGCIDCHVDDGDHAMTGGHDLDRVRGALALDLRWDGPTTLRATLTATGVGHRLPTGDPFRRVVLELCATEACATPLSRAVWGRRFRRTDRTWALAEDTSVPPPQDGPSASRALPVDAPSAATRWRLVLHYADPALHLPAALDHAVLDAGPLPPRPSGPGDPR